MAVSYFGCKIPPTDIQEALFRIPRLAASVDGFQLRTYEDEDGDKRLTVHLEYSNAAADTGVPDWSGTFFDMLAEINQDFRESRRMVPDAKAPQLKFHGVGSGPFVDRDGRVKRQYVTEA